MRNFLTFVAVALVTALMVALIAPPLIDWSARRDMVARAIAVRIGAPVRISGPIGLRLLPTPYLEVADFAIGSRRAPWLTGRAMRFELALSSLFGVVALDDLAFDRPTLHLGPRLTAPDDARLAIGHIRAAHAEIEVARIGAAPILLHDVNFDGAATSLRGPWRVEGDLAFGADRARYRLVSDAFADDGLPLRGDLDAGATHAEIDGRLAFAESATFTGAATVDGAVAGPENRRLAVADRRRADRRRRAGEPRRRPSPLRRGGARGRGRRPHDAAFRRAPRARRRPQRQELRSRRAAAAEQGDVDRAGALRRMASPRSAARARRCSNSR